MERTRGVEKGQGKKIQRCKVKVGVWRSEPSEAKLERRGGVGRIGGGGKGEKVIMAIKKDMII